MEDRPALPEPLEDRVEVEVRVREALEHRLEA